MKHWRKMAMVMAVAMLLFARPLWSCGPFFTFAIFAAPAHPDTPFDPFVGGRLGIVKSTWNRSYRYIAYRYIAGPGFDPAEQAAMLSLLNGRLGLETTAATSDRLDAHTMLGVSSGNSVSVSDASGGWIAARGKVPGVSALDKIEAYRSGPGQYSLFYYANCNDSSFHTAAKTLGAMIEKFGLSGAPVKQWVDAQDEVFQNCSNFPPGAPWTAGSSDKPPQVKIPDPLKDGTPFEQAQRAYQIACANFYGGNFDAAIKLFGAIAADSASPWHGIAPYLVARATIRKATLSGEKNDPAILALGETQLHKIIAAPGSDDEKAAAQRLLGFVDAQLHPDQQVDELARAIMKPGSEATLRQKVSDYLWLLNHGQLNKSAHTDDLTDWILSFDKDAGTPPDHFAQQWKKTASIPWLIAAISVAHGTDANAPALIKAAEDVTPDSPAYATATYQVARLMIEQGKADDARVKLDAILATRDSLPRSAANEFESLRMKVARNLDELLKYAQRIPLGITDTGDVEELPETSLDPEVKVLAAGPLFDADGAEVLSKWLPLNLQKQAAQSAVLSPYLRGQVAMAAWTKAILLGNMADARELAPIAGDLVPALKTPLEKWSTAKGPAAKRFDAAYMLLLNPGIRPTVDPGVGRNEPIGTIDDYRDNWWPSMVASRTTFSDSTPTAEPAPGFLSAAEKSSAEAEWNKLSTVNAPNFLCSESIAWARSGSGDDRAPEALSKCVMAVKLGDSNCESTKIGKAAFDLLHRKYPDSAWAKRTKFWYSGSDCATPTPTPAAGSS